METRKFQKFYDIVSFMVYLNVKQIKKDPAAFLKGKFT